MTFNKLFYIVFFCCFCLMQPLYAETRIIPGWGPSISSAVQNALIEAVRQRCGAQIASEKLSAMNHLHSSKSNEKKGNNFSFDSKQITDEQIKNNVKSDVSVKSGGYIAGYKILSQKYDKEIKEYFVEIEVEYASYEIPSEDKNRRRLFVHDVKAKGCVGCQTYIKAPVVLKKYLINGYTDSRKFSVLDRENEEVYENETDLINSDRVQTNEKARLNMFWATDYIVMPAIKKVFVSVSKEQLKLTGETIYTKSASAVVDYQISIYASGQIKYAGEIKVSLSQNEMNGLSKEMMVERLMKKAASSIVLKSVAAIYPPVILQKTGKTVIVNISDNLVQIGDEYEVFNVSQENLIDPYTKESLGPIETYIGKIKITDVKPKYSVGQVVSGKAEEVQLGAICRKKKGAK